jgi:uncharacterized protein Yka (UPF0111/DUF47 family)
MFSLQRLFGKEDRFFELLKASAEEARASVEALGRYLSRADRERSLSEFIASRRKEKQIYNEISETLSRTFVTRLEREDIEALSLSLYKVPKTVEKIAEHIQISPHLLTGVDLQREIATLNEAASILVEMTAQLHRGMNLERTKELNDRLQEKEAEADKLMLEHLRAMYSGRYNAVTVVFLKDLLDLLERVFERCRNAGNVVNQIVLKNA